MFKNSQSQRSELRSALSTLVLVLIYLGGLAAIPSPLAAQNNSIWNRDELYGPSRQRVPTMQETSLIRSPPMKPLEIRLRDAVTVRVDELARTQSEGEVEQRKNATYDARILDWIRFNGFRSVESTQADGVDPAIGGQLNQLFRGEADFETTERLTFNITTEVVDILPNGHLIIEGFKEIRINEEVWLYEISGRCRQQDVGVDNTVLSRNLLDLRITKKEHGQVRDGYKRGWLQRFLDQVSPF